ncbi:MAG: Flp pilus assembly protein CpaB [Planctomycetota bacterium]|nr:Flp pilus assembly protein CpaB [Planctomycetota bacterium]
MASIPKETVYIVLAAGCAVGGFLLQRNYVEGTISDVSSQLTNTVKVVELNQRISTGEVLTKDMCATVEIPVGFVHPRMVREGDLGRVVGNPVRTPVEKNEPLLWNVMNMGAGTSVVEKISEGEKAVTLPVNLVTGGAGLLRPNMRVDIYGTFRQTSGAETEGGGNAEVPDLSAVRLLENVIVVAVGTEAGLDSGSAERINESANYNTISILVNSGDVEKVLLALELTRSMGTSLYCVLRSEMDEVKEQRPARPVSTRELLDWLKAPKVSP